MLFCHRSPQSPHHRLDIRQQTPLRMRVRFLPLLVVLRSVAPLHLGYDDQTFFVSDLDGKRRTTTRPYCRVTEVLSISV
jgi:hypothetical protein